jgi:type III pantothenate kinase
MTKEQKRFLQLEFDAGNSRIKWRLRQREHESPWQTLASGAVMAPNKIPSVFLELRDQFVDLPLRAIDRVLVANVRGDGFKQAFSAFLSEKMQLSSEFVSVCRDGVPVEHCYQEERRLGVDRWLAMLAAYDRGREACVVIDCGTTITVDLVDAAGKHMGGYILPGLRMMRDALTDRSTALVIETLPWETSRPGHNTAEAIHHGILALTSGFLRDLHHRLPPGLVEPRWFMTGGDAILLKPHLDWLPEIASDLVLDGLELVPGRT